MLKYCTRIELPLFCFVVILIDSLDCGLFRIPSRDFYTSFFAIYNASMSYDIFSIDCYAIIEC